MLFKTKVKNPLALHDPRTRKFGTKHGIRKRRAGAMLLRGLLTTRTLLLSRACRRASTHRSIAACANQVNNPNNVAFWQSRGVASRPGDWKSKVAQRAADGRLQAVANGAAYRSKEARAAAGRRNKIIVRAVKDSLGSHVQVHKVGSQVKHTDVARSDQDFWVDVGDDCLSRAKRKVLRDNLTSMLNKGAKVELRECAVRILLDNDEHVDIAFSSYCFSSKPHHKPAQRFTNNPKARDAVRLIKAANPQKFKGEAIEKAVIAAQGQKKGQSFDTVALAAFRLLAHKPQVEKFRAWLSDGDTYEYDVDDDDYDDEYDDDDDDWDDDDDDDDEDWDDEDLRPL